MFLLLTDVLSLGQFEDVLLPVDDLEAAVFGPRSNVAGVKPSVLIDSLSSLLRIVQISCYEHDETWQITKLYKTTNETFIVLIRVSEGTP